MKTEDCPLFCYRWNWLYSPLTLYIVTRSQTSVSSHSSNYPSIPSSWSLLSLCAVKGFEGGAKSNATAMDSIGLNETGSEQYAKRARFFIKNVQDLPVRLHLRRCTVCFHPPAPFSEEGGGQIFLKTFRASLLHKDLSNEPNFGRIHLAGQYL